MACTFPTTTPSVNDWLDALNLGRYKAQFAAANLTDVAQLHSLADEALQAAGVTLIGHRKRMLQAVKHLHPPPGPAALPMALPVPTPPLEARMMDMDVDDVEEGIEAFLLALTDDFDRDIPTAVPSGLPPGGAIGP